MADAKPAPAIARLAKLVLNGDVVFFIGAGFSIDSEGNTARRLMRRLIIRLLAFVESDIGDAAELFRDFVGKFHLDPGGLLSRAPNRLAARVIWLTLGGVRRCHDGEPSSDAEFDGDDIDIEALLIRLQTDGDTRRRLRDLVRALGEWPVNRLARDYYEVNEWFCLAYETLLTKLRPADLGRLAQREEEIRRQMNGILRARAENELDLLEIEPAPLQPLRSWFLHDEERFDPRLAGKALFLETVGFADTNVMGGKFEDPDPAVVERTFHGRLLPRHHVLARFAREGWCPTVITTNFDRLIEGAYRLAGFRYGERARQAPGASIGSFPDTLISSYDVVASAEEFCRKAKAFRTAVVVKIHGCADRYRRLADAYSAVAANADEAPRLRAELEECVRSLVFTYREIQHWRNDDWAADYLRTTLRTRTVVFCGYSVRDPVIHDTFRGAFEEMSRLSIRRPAGRDRKPDATTSAEAAGPVAAPLFVVTSAGDRAFHSEAVLHAATEAVGERASYLEDHPNRIDFHFRNGSFPDLDEVFRWLQHLTWRERQRECVQSYLARTAALFGARGDSGRGFQRMRRTQLERVEASFTKLVANEESLDLDARQDAAKSAASRRAFTEASAWTEQFHVGLLREFACAEDARRLALPNVQVALIRRNQWYFPVMESPVWTCWGVVIELALRAAARAFGCTLSVADCARPTVFFHAAEGGRPRTPFSLTIEFAGAERAAASPEILGATARRVVWELKPEDLPWPLDDRGFAARAEKVGELQFAERRKPRGSRFTTYGDPAPGWAIWDCAAQTSRFASTMADFLPGLVEYMRRTPTPPESAHA